MRLSLVGRLTRLQLGSGTTSQPRHKTTSASLRTTLEFQVCQFILTLQYTAINVKKENTKNVINTFAEGLLTKI